MKRPRNKAKAAKLVKALLENDLNQAEAAKELGVTRQAVQDQVKENPLVRNALLKYQDALEAAGANDEKSARVISEAMDARTHKGVGFGEDFQIIEEDDHYARLKANEQYLKVKKLLSDSQSTPAGGNHIHFHLGEKADNELVKDIRSQMAAFGTGKPSSAGRGTRKSKG